MTGKERLLNALLQKDVDRIPVAGVVTAVNKSAMKHAGATFRDVLTSAEKLAALAAAPYELYGLESIKLPFDMTVEAEILGAQIDFGDDYRLPQAHKPRFNDPAEFETPDDLQNRGRLPMFAKAVEILRDKYADRVAVITSVVGPFSLANIIFGFEKLLIWMVTEPQLYHKCLEATTNFSMQQCAIQEKMGSDILMIGEAACSGDLISSEDYHKNILPYHRRLFSSIDVPTVIHICGNISNHFEYIPETNVDGISFDDGNDMALARKYCKGKVAMLGYVHPTKLLLDGTPDQIRAKCRECLENGVDVLHAGCAWPPDVPDENARAFAGAIGN